MGFRVALPELRQPTPLPTAGKTRVQVGIHRDIDDARARRIDGAALAWEAASDGGYATTFAVASAGARAVQLAMRVDALPTDAEVRFFNPADTTEAHGPFRSDLLLPAADVRARADGSELFWSPVINGAELGVEIYLPRRPRAGELQFALAKVAHLTRTIAGRDLTDLGASGSCNRNITCYKRWASAAASVAKYIFQSDGRSFQCTGQLMVDSDASSQRLWFLTAAHCMTKNAETKSAVLYWGFEHARCAGGDTPPIAQTAGGGKLRFTTKINGRSTDHTLMELRRSPPAGTNFSGWSFRDPDELLRKTVQGVHHPSGDAKKGSTGRVGGMDGLDFGSGVQVVAGDSHLRVEWKRNKGVTEAGSSGSGLWYGTRWPNQVPGRHAFGRSSIVCQPHGLRLVR